MNDNFSSIKNIFGLYSRQIIDLGQKTMIKLSKLKVLILFVRGLGIEISKNIILAGPESVTIFDPNITKINDLNSNFYLKEEFVNEKRRDEAVIYNLKNLNEFVKVDFLKDNTLNDIIKIIPKNYDAVILTELISQKKSIEIDDVCRKNNIPFIYTAALGLTGFIFTDFGNEHKIYEKSNKELKKYMIKNITKEKNGICEIIRDEKESGKFFEKYVIFKNIEGMTELNIEN
jgi:ubiquitin-activating enzyme E1